MNKSGHWGIRALGHWGNTKFLSRIFFSNFLVFIIAQCPNALFSQSQHPLSAEGDRQFNQQHFDSALICYNQLIQEFPDRKEGYFNRGLCLYKTDKFSEAIFDLDEAFRMDSSLTDAKLLKGFSLEKRGDLNEAMMLFGNVALQNTMHTLLDRRIKNYQLAVMISSKWYYMLMMALLLIIVVAVVSKSLKRI